MPSKRIQRQIDTLLDQAEEAVAQADWAAVLERADGVLAIDADDEDALAFRAITDAGQARRAGGSPEPALAGTVEAAAQVPVADEPDSFTGGRYAVRELLGEGGKKRVYLAHDELLDRDVAFALVRTESLDATGRERVRREAQAMGRLGPTPTLSQSSTLASTRTRCTSLRS